MDNLQLNEDSETDDPNNMYSIGDESSLQLPLDNSTCIVFTGHYNGVGVEVRSPDEMKLLYHMGCFGKGTTSRSRPKPVTNSPQCMRRRQFLKRNYWYKRFGKTQKKIGPDTFVTDIDHLVAKILNDTRKQSGKDVINLVSSDDDDDQEETASLTESSDFDDSYKQNAVVIVPNSDSEDDNYFANLKPKYCVNKILLQEKLMLTLQEAFFLLYGLGCLQIVNNENILNIQECWNLFSENNSDFVEKYVVYHYFRSKGYIVKPGIKFGGDYLLYQDGPGVNHADYIVVIDFGKENLDWISLLGHVRMATTTVKEVLIAEVKKSNKENIKLPQDLHEYSVREMVLTRKIPVKINSDDN